MKNMFFGIFAIFFRGNGRSDVNRSDVNRNDSNERNGKMTGARQCGLWLACACWQYVPAVSALLSLPFAYGAFGRPSAAR
jgi:hypothetical protein